MAKNTTSNTSSTTKRSFGVSAESIATVRQFIKAGLYAAKITGATINSPFGENKDKNSIRIVDVTEWKKDEMNPTTGKMGWQKPTGKKRLEGNIYFTATLLSKKAIQELQRDEPVIFGGQIELGFTPEGELDPKNNIALINTAKALGIDLDEILDNTNAGFSYDEGIEVPEELASVSGIVDLLNAVQYHTDYFAEVVARMNDLQCKIDVAVVDDNRTQGQKNNVINSGRNKSGFSTGRLCAVHAWEDGCDLDLEESEG
jgi:hypothetical protein